MHNWCLLLLLLLLLLDDHFVALVEFAHSLQVLVLGARLAVDVRFLAAEVRDAFGKLVDDVEAELFVVLILPVFVHFCAFEAFQQDF